MTLTSADTFADFADVVRHLQLEPDSADALSVDGVMAALQFATDLIRSACGWRITQETVTVARRYRSALIDLDTLWLTAVSAVSVAGVARTEPDGFTWTPYGLITLTSRPCSTDLVSITYTHGYSTTDPKLRGLRAVCAELAGSKVSVAAGVSRPLAALTVGNVTEQYERATTVYSAASSASETDRLRQDARVAPFVLPVVG